MNLARIGEPTHTRSSKPHPSVAYFTKEVNPRLAKRPLVFNGRLANRGLTSLVKEATVCTSHGVDCLRSHRTSLFLQIKQWRTPNISYHLVYVGYFILCPEIIEEALASDFFLVAVRHSVYWFLYWSKIRRLTMNAIKMKIPWDPLSTVKVPLMARSE